MVALAVNLEVPLYPTYAGASGVGAAVTSVVFAVYVAALVPMLVLLGGLSDRIGRRPVVLASLGLAAAATVSVWLLPTIVGLLAARALQGIGVGLCMSAATAWLTEAWPDGRGARLVATTTALGFGGGALFTSASLALGLRDPPGSYVFVLVGTVVAAIGVATTPVGRRNPAAPLLRGPAWPAGSHVPGMAIALAWAMCGLVIAVVPGVLASHGLAVWSGPALFAVTGGGVLVHPISRRLEPGRRLRVGLGVLPVGAALLIAGALLGALAPFLAGALLVGTTAYSLIYLGGLDQVTALAGAERAPAVAGFFLYAYFGFSVPVITVGVLTDTWGPTPTLVAVAATVSVLSAILVWISRR